MTYEFFCSFKSLIIRWPRHLLMAGGLCLLVACGGGGGGGDSPSSATASPTAAPAVTFTQVNSSATVYSGNRIQMTPSYNYGSGVITWVDGNGQAQTRQVVNPGTPVDDYPTATTTYTLTVKYQDPSTVRPNELTTTRTITVTITPIDLAPPTLGLVATPAGPVASGTSVAVTPSISFDSSKINITSSTLTNSVTNVTTAVTSGVALNQTITANTTFTLRVTYADIRVTPNVNYAALTTTTTVNLSTAPATLTPGGLMQAGRSEQIAILLPTNKVLVAGGTNNGSTPLRTAELYDPDTNTWSSTGSMVVARRGHTATLMLDGKILVTGGFDGTVETATAEIYDPATGIWTATGPMGRGRKYHTASRLIDGKILIAGGIVATNIGNARIAEIYDPLLATFTSLTTEAQWMSAPRYKHTASVLSDGKTVVLTGGFDPVVQGTTEVFTYTPAVTGVGATPASYVWTTGPVLQKARYDHAASLLPGNRKILLTGGYAQGADTFEICDFTAGSTPACTESLNRMSTARALHTSTLLPSGKILLVGGNDGSQLLKTTEVLSPVASVAATTDTWTADTTEMRVARAGHSSTLLSNGKVLISGANNQVSGITTSSTELWVAPTP